MSDPALTPDPLLCTLADYVLAPPQFTELAYQTARCVLIDSLGCALKALEFGPCTAMLGPIVEGTKVPDGARVPGTPYQLDPVQATFNLGSMIRWLDFNDTWLAAEWGHPSDNLGAILMVADWLSRTAQAGGKPPLSMRCVLAAMIQAHEIQGVLALGNAFNQVGLDHVILVKLASTAVVATMLGLSRERIINAISHAWIDGHPLRTYRHAPNTGSRKSWAAGDAAARAVQLALIARKGEMGYPCALSAKRWGFNDVLLQGREVVLERPLGCYVMENVLFKVAYPAEFHAQTAVECALQLHRQLAESGRQVEDIAHIHIRTHEACLRIIDKQGPLRNPADRDHCIQYMVAVPLIFGRLLAEDYEDGVACDPRIDALRARIDCFEDPQFSRDYLDPDKRSIANGLTVTFQDGTSLPEVVCEYPLGHRRRRDEAWPLLEDKFFKALEGHIGPADCAEINTLIKHPDALDNMPVDHYVDLYCRDV